MTAIQYELVYRLGAAQNAPVSRYFLCDTGTDLNGTTSSEGDIGYVKEFDSFYFRSSAYGWIAVANQYFSNFYRNVSIRGPAVPALIIQDTASNVEHRISNLNGGNQLEIGNNFSNAGAGYVKNDNAKNGLMLRMDILNRLFELWDWPAGGSMANLFSFNIANDYVTFNTKVAALEGLHEYGRSNPQGVWIDVPYASGNFGWTVPATNILSNRYTIVGKTVHWSFWAYSTTIPASIGDLAIVCPIAPSAGYFTGHLIYGSHADDVSPGIVYTMGDPYIRIRKGPGTSFQSWNAGTVDLQFSISYGIA